MKGIHIQFESIINFLDSSIKNANDYTHECYLLNLEKMTLQAFTVLNIVLSNTEVPLQIRHAFEKTIDKFKEYFKHKPKFQNDPQDQQSFQYDQVQHFLDSRVELNRPHESERGQLYKFLNQTEQKQKNNKILLENIPIYSYGNITEKLTPREHLGNATSKNSIQPTFKERSQQTYSNDFIACVTEDLAGKLQNIIEEKQVQTETSLQGLREILQSYLYSALTDQDQEQIKKTVVQTLVLLQTSSLQVMNSILKDKFGVEPSLVQQEQIQDFLTKIIEANQEHPATSYEIAIKGPPQILKKKDPHFNSSQSLPKTPCQKEKKSVSKSKSKQKQNTRTSARGSEIVKGQDKSYKGSKVDVLKIIDENHIKKNLTTGTQKTVSIPNKNKRIHRESIKILQSSTKLRKTKKTKHSEIFSKSSKIVSQNKEQLKEVNKEVSKELSSNSIQQHIIPQANELKEQNAGTPLSSDHDRHLENEPKEEKIEKIEGDDKEQLRENNDKEEKENKENEQINQKEIMEENVEEKEKNEERNKKDQQKEMKKIKENNEKQKNKDKQAIDNKGQNNFRMSDLLESENPDNDNWQKWDPKQNDLYSPNNLQQQPKKETTLPPLIEKSLKIRHSPMLQYKLNSKKRHDHSQYSINSKHLISGQSLSKQKSANPNNRSLYLSLSHSFYSPNNATSYKHSPTITQSKFPNIKFDSTSKNDLSNENNQLSSQEIRKEQFSKENQRIINEISQNASVKRNKHVQWLKLIKNIKQYEQLHFRHCGQCCIHLSKFYQFLKKHNLSMYINRKYLSLHKTNIEINPFMQ